MIKTTNLEKHRDKRINDNRGKGLEEEDIKMKLIHFIKGSRQVYHLRCNAALLEEKYKSFRWNPNGWIKKKQFNQRHRLEII
jgi:hypothetical protein